MDDERLWAFEESLWLGDAEHYRRSIDDACLMVLPAQPFVMSGYEAIEAVARTPRWSRVELSQRRVSRPQEGVIVAAYKANAFHDDRQSYQAFCTSVYRRAGPDDWKIVQHQQTPPPVVPSESIAVQGFDETAHPPDGY